MRCLVLHPWVSEGLLQRPGPGRMEVPGMDSNVQMLPTLAFVLTSKSEGKKGGRKNLNKETFQKSS